MSDIFSLVLKWWPIPNAEDKCSKYCTFISTNGFLSTKQTYTVTVRRGLRKKWGILSLLGSVAFLKKAIVSPTWIQWNEFQENHFQSPQLEFFLVNFLIWNLTLCLSEKEKMERSESVNDSNFFHGKDIWVSCGTIGHYSKLLDKGLVSFLFWYKLVKKYFMFLSSA